MNKNILIICATDDSIRINRVVEYIPSIKMLIPRFDIKDYNLFYNNVADLTSVKDNKCLMDIYNSDDIEKDISEKCSKFSELNNNKFDIIVLEHCMSDLNSTKSFINFSKLLKPKGFIILDSFDKFKGMGIETIESLTTLLEDPKTSVAEILAFAQEGLDDFGAELNAYYDERGIIAVGEGRVSHNLLLGFILFNALDYIKMSRITTFNGVQIESMDEFNERFLNPIGLTCKSIGVDQNKKVVIRKIDIQ